MGEAAAGAPPPLALLLIQGGRWFDDRSLTELERRGWPRLTPAQSLVFAHLDEAGTAPAVLARRLGRSRQAVQELVGGLCRLGLLALVDDPARRNGRLVTLSTSGRRLVGEAYTVLTGLEAELGPQLVERLRPLLLQLRERQEALDRP